MKEMTYKKCMHCPHVSRRYNMGGGLILICWIMGKMLEIEECPE